MNEIINVFKGIFAALTYILYAGVAESLSATYYKVKKPYLFQVALGLTGFLMMIYLLDVTAGKWYQFLSFFSTSALIFVAFTPDYKRILEGKVHAVSAYVSAGASVLLLVLMGFWYEVDKFTAIEEQYAKEIRKIVNQYFSTN